MLHICSFFECLALGHFKVSYQRIYKEDFLVLEAPTFYRNFERQREKEKKKH